MRGEKSDEGLDAFVREFALEERGGFLFNSALAEFFDGRTAGGDEFSRLFKRSGLHRFDEALGFFELRRAEHRNDALERPVVKGALVFEFERADRMRDFFERVFDRMRKGVHRVDAPLVARCMVLSEADAVDRRIAEIHVGARHVDAGAKHHRAFGVLAVAHFAEEAQVLFNRAVAVGRVLARLLQGAAVFAHFVGRLLIDVGVARLDQMLSEGVHVLEVRARKVEVLFVLMLPREAEPADAVENAVDVLLVFLHRVRVVEAHVATAAVVAGKAEIEADALGVADVKVAVRFRREARADLCRVGQALGRLFGIRRRMSAPEPGLVRTGSKVFFNNVADEVGSAPSLGFRVFAHRRIPKGKKEKSALRLRISGIELR